MNLRYPFLLLLLIPAIALVVYSLFRRLPLRISPLHRMKKAGKTWRTRLWFLPELGTLVFFVTAIILLSGPQRQVAPDSEHAQGLSIVLAFDRSSSMSAIIPYGNSRISRIDGVKEVTRDFFTQRKDDQFAIVSFARYPETNTPLTGNKTILLDFLNFIKVPESEVEDGTAIGDALVLSTAHLATDKKKSGIIILLTDGQNNRGEKTPEEGAIIAQENGVTVYTIGLGGEGYIIQDTPNGPQAMGMPVAIDEDTLNAIARKTGGKYYHANGLSDLSSFYQDIAERETTKLEQKRNPKMELRLERGIILLGLLLFLIVLCRYFLLRRRDS